MWAVALLAAVTMVVTDVLGVIMVQAEAANRGWLAGLMDSLGWLFSIATTTISVTALSGHSMEKKILVVSFVTAANFLGTKLGQIMGQRLMNKTGRQSIADHVQGLEKRLEALEAR
jgi:hypothetical protein